jgi:hypothetical protein
MGLKVREINLSMRDSPIAGAAWQWMMVNRRKNTLCLIVLFFCKPVKGDALETLSGKKQSKACREAVRISSLRLSSFFHAGQGASTASAPAFDAFVQSDVDGAAQEIAAIQARNCRPGFMTFHIDSGNATRLAGKKIPAQLKAENFSVAAK